MERETLVSEIIAEMQERLRDVVTEIDRLDCDCDKAKFIINEMMELIDTKPIETETDIYRLQGNMERFDNLTGIAFDYIDKIQSCISDIVHRERRRSKETQ